MISSLTFRIGWDAFRALYIAMYVCVRGTNDATYVRHGETARGERQTASSGECGRSGVTFASDLHLQTFRFHRRSESSFRVYYLSKRLMYSNSPSFTWESGGGGGGGCITTKREREMKCHENEKMCV